MEFSVSRAEVCDEDRVLSIRLKVLVVSSGLNKVSSHFLVNEEVDIAEIVEWLSLDKSSSLEGSNARIVEGAKP